MIKNIPPNVKGTPPKSHINSFCWIALLVITIPINVVSNPAKVIEKNIILQSPLQRLVLCLCNL